jgi:SAM-dependent methyltransferase
MSGKLRRIAKTLTPKFIRRTLETPLGKRLRYFGFSHYCPVCRSYLRNFLDYGQIHILRSEECPICGAHRRHRLMWLYFRDKLRLSEKPRFSILHVAPESRFSEMFQRSGNIDYLSADFASPIAMVKMDLTAIQYKEGSFDAIYCSHVLEHIPDDRKAISELYRVLRPGGWAILQVPIDLNRDVTFEDPSIILPDDRERAFWQFDHVRLYGQDYRKRLESAGFHVSVDSYVREFSSLDIRKLGLDVTENIYFCTKPQ